MSSCEGSCCTCSRKASCASATSASSAPATVPRSSRCAFGYSNQQPQSQYERARPTTIRPVLLGRVLDATGRCCCSNGSPLCNFAFELHPICSRRQYDTHRKTSPTGNVHRREQDRCARYPQPLTLLLTTPHIFIHCGREICALSLSPCCTGISCAFENP
jgi:hypothetical protein